MRICLIAATLSLCGCYRSHELESSREAGEPGAGCGLRTVDPTTGYAHVLGPIALHHRSEPYFLGSLVWSNDGRRLATGGGLWARSGAPVNVFPTFVLDGVGCAPIASLRPPDQVAPNLFLSSEDGGPLLSQGGSEVIIRTLTLQRDAHDPSRVSLGPGAAFSVFQDSASGFEEVSTTVRTEGRVPYDLRRLDEGLVAAWSYSVEEGTTAVTLYRERDGELVEFRHLGFDELYGPDEPDPAEPHGELGFAGLAVSSVGRLVTVQGLSGADVDDQVRLLEVTRDLELRVARSLPVPHLGPIPERVTDGIDTEESVPGVGISAAGDVILVDRYESLIILREEADDSWSRASIELGPHFGAALSPDGHRAAWIVGFAGDDDPDALTIADIGEDGIVERWTGYVPDEAAEAECAAGPRMTTAIAFAPDGRLAVAASPVCGPYSWLTSVYIYE